MSKMGRIVLSILLLLGVTSVEVLADGTETIGPPSVPISAGSGILASGTGLHAQPGEINMVIPNGVAISQVLLYWEGEHVEGTAGDNTIVVNGIEVIGTLIGGPTLFFSNVLFSSFRADYT